MPHSVPQGYQHGVYSLSVRPITDGERKVALDSLKFFRYNALGFAIVGMMTAIATMLFATDIVMLLVPVLFVLIAGDYANKYKKNSDLIAKGLTPCTVPEIAGVPEKKGRGSWSLGPMTVFNKGGLAKMLPEGETCKMAFLPDARIVLSVNGTPLKKAVPVVMTPADFAKDLTLPAYPAAPAPMPSPCAVAPPSLTVEDLPPPPDDWEGLICGKCGQSNPADASFCGRCGAVIQR